MKSWIAALVAVGLVGLWAAFAQARQRTTIAPADRQAILDLISRYSYVVDTFDVDAWPALFTDEGVFVARLGDRVIATLRTRDEHLAFASDRKTNLAGKGIRSRHYQTNTLLEPAPDGTITGQTMYLVAWQRVGEPAPVPVHTGVYKDVFARTRAGWKFARREALTDHE